MKTKEESLCEIVQSQALQVDRAAGVIHGVRILGPRSANGRRYLPEAIQKAVGLYEGRQVNYNHPKRDDPGADRSIDDRAGWLQNVRVENDGLTGDFHFLKSDPRAEKVCEAADRNPRLFGFSHNADGRTRREGGQTLVEEIIKVRSVDLVSDPATTRSLFESEEKPMKILEALRAIFTTAPQIKMLREIEDAGIVTPEMTAEAPAEASSDEQMKTAFRQMVIATYDDPAMDLKATILRIKEILKVQEKLLGGVGDNFDEEAVEEEPVEENPSEEEGGEKKPPEKKKEEETDESKKNPPPIPDVTKLVESLQGEIAALKEAVTVLKGQVGVEKPRSGVAQTGNGDWKPPTDASDFAKRAVIR